MIELKILSNHPGELRIVANALNQLADMADGEEVATYERTELPDMLKEQNPVGPAVKQGTALDPETPEVDKDGYPWDKRIHSTAHSTNQNGTWKVLRRPKVFGDDDEKWQGFIERTRAELRGEDPDTPQDDPAAVFGGGNTENPTPQENPSTNNGSAGQDDQKDPNEPTSTAGITFAELMKFVTSHKDKISIPKVNEICTNYGLNALSDLQKDDSMIDIIYNDLINLVEG